ncbi:MAG: TetR/AcrR family transcriptional regulator [Sphingomonadales bacterium]
MTQAERTALSDQRMYDAAMTLIGRHGTHNTTLKEVGELAGYSRGLASYRFGSKEALFGNLVTFFNHKWVEELDRFVGGRTGLAAFIAALDAVEDFLLEQPDYMKAMYILWYESITSHSEVRERLAEQHEAYRTDIVRWVKEGIAEGFIRPYVDAEKLSVQFCSFIFGTIYQWLVKPEAIDIKVAFGEYKQGVLALIVERRRAPR